VGYESEYTFNRAFKRRVGSPPAAWRKKVKDSGPQDLVDVSHPTTVRNTN
jgi:AraC-like DNA-binding protein